MLRNFSLLLIITLAIFSQSCSQSSMAYRNKNWNPKSGNYYFNTMLTWSYENELASEDHLKKGEISIYIDEKSGTFLFTKESYGWSGEMIDFVIADQKGNYIIGHTDEFGKKHRETKKASQFADVMAQTKSIVSEFKKYCKPTEKTKIFGKNAYGWPTETGKEYVLSYQKTEDISNLFLSTEKYSFLPLFLFNKLEMDAKLPISFDYSLMIPSEKLVLEDTHIYNELKTKLTLESISPTDYFINLNEYKKQ